MHSWSVHQECQSSLHRCNEIPEEVSVKGEGILFWFTSLAGSFGWSIALGSVMRHYIIRLCGKGNISPYGSQEAKRGMGWGSIPSRARSLWLSFLQLLWVLASLDRATGWWSRPLGDSFLNHSIVPKCIFGPGHCQLMMDLSGPNPITKTKNIYLTRLLDRYIKW